MDSRVFKKTELIDLEGGMVAHLTRTPGYYQEDGAFIPTARRVEGKTLHYRPSALLILRPEDLSAEVYVPAASIYIGGVKELAVLAEALTAEVAVV